MIWGVQDWILAVRGALGVCGLKSPARATFRSGRGCRPLALLARGTAVSAARERWPPLRAFSAAYSAPSPGSAKGRGGGSASRGSSWPKKPAPHKPPFRSAEPEGIVGIRWLLRARMFAAIAGGQGMPLAHFTQPDCTGFAPRVTPSYCSKRSAKGGCQVLCAAASSLTDAFNCPSAHPIFRTCLAKHLSSIRPCLLPRMRWALVSSSDLLPPPWPTSHHSCGRVAEW